MAITNIYKGALERSDIQKIYKGTTLLYEKLSTPSIPPRYVQTTTADFNASGLYWNRRIYYITSRQTKWLQNTKYKCKRWLQTVIT